MNIIDQEIKHLFQQATYANSNKKSAQYKKISFKLFLFMFISGFVFLMYFSFMPFTSISAIKDLNEIQSETYISPVEKLTYKKLIKQIALKEKRHPNSIHSELRKAFNYRSYFHLTKEQYQQIVSYLHTRL